MRLLNASPNPSVLMPNPWLLRIAVTNLALSLVLSVWGQFCRVWNYGMEGVRLNGFLDATRARTPRSSKPRARVVSVPFFRCRGKRETAVSQKYGRSHTRSNRHHFENSEPRRCESDTPLTAR